MNALAKASTEKVRYEGEVIAFPVLPSVAEQIAEHFRRIPGGQKIRVVFKERFDETDAGLLIDMKTRGLVVFGEEARSMINAVYLSSGHPDGTSIDLVVAAKHEDDRTQSDPRKFERLAHRLKAIKIL